MSKVDFGPLCTVRSSMKETGKMGYPLHYVKGIDNCYKKGDPHQQL